MRARPVQRCARTIGAADDPARTADMDTPPSYVVPMDEMTWVDCVSALAALLSAVFSLGLLVVAVLAWNTARKALNASRDAAAASETAAVQAKRSVEAMEQDSALRTSQNEQATRPYVFARLVPSLAGTASNGWDLAIENGGLSAAYDVTMHVQSDDDGAEPNDALRDANDRLANSGQMLAPGQRIRSMWHLPEDERATPSAQMGFGRAVVRFSYRNAGHTAYDDDDPIVLDPNLLGMTPQPNRGAVASSSDPDKEGPQDVVNALRQISEYLGELNR